MPLHQIVTVEWLKRVYLYGIDLTDDENNEYPDDLWRLSIDSAIALAEAQFDVVLRANRRYTSTERYDSVDWSAESWHLLQVHHRPVTRVNRLSIRYGSRDPSDLPLSWVRLSNKKAGQIQIIPGPEGFAGFSYAVGGVPWPGFELVNYRYLPGWFELEYEAGWEYRLKGAATTTRNSRTVTLASGLDDDGKATTPEAANELKVGNWVVFDDDPDKVVRRVRAVNSHTEFETTETVGTDFTGSNVTVLSYDPLLVDFVGLMASLLPLDTAGDLIIGAGISSQSLSMDGLSQSISTTAGVENSGYGARAVQYGKRIETITKQLTRHYRPIQAFVL